MFSLPSSERGFDIFFSASSVGCFPIMAFLNASLCFSVIILPLNAFVAFSRLSGFYHINLCFFDRFSFFIDSDFFLLTSGRLAAALQFAFPFSDILNVKCPLRSLLIVYECLIQFASYILEFYFTP